MSTINSRAVSDLLELKTANRIKTSALIIAH